MRQIVSTPDVIGGRWSLSGHRIDVRCIRGWLRVGGLDLFNENYPHVNLTQEEADTCLAWDFPPIHATAVVDDLGAVICRCGEWGDFTGGAYTCRWCGRQYRIETTVTEVQQ